MKKYIRTCRMQKSSPWTVSLSWQHSYVSITYDDL